MEASMNTKKFVQFFVLMSVLISAFATTSAAFAWGCGTSVTVVSGDTLLKIANRCGTTVSALRRANPSIGTGDLIYPGQSLLLPGAIINTDGGYIVYVVARGDTVKSLATRFSSTVDSIVSTNPAITNVNLIYEGQRLNIFAVVTVPTTPPPASGQVYYVQRGDTLKIIAAKFNTTVDTILQLNHILNPNLIYVGQGITLPAGVSSYIVQRGDTLRIIANKFGTTVDNLLVLNPSIKNPNLIYVGQVLKVS
jgi:peptidoglycan endopeptidase LytE